MNGRPRSRFSLSQSLPTLPDHNSNGSGITGTTNNNNNHNHATPEEGSLDWFINREKGLLQKRPLDNEGGSRPITTTAHTPKKVRLLGPSTPSIPKPPPSVYTIRLDLVSSSLDTKERICHQLIHTLFYSDRRGQIFKSKNTSLLDEMVRIFKSHLRQFDKNESINIMDLYTYMYGAYIDKTYLVECDHKRVLVRTKALKMNPIFINAATDLIMVQYKILIQTPWGVENQDLLDANFFKLALTILNKTKRQGQSMVFKCGNMEQEVVLIPTIQYSVDYYPPKADLSLYGVEFNGNAITQGTHYINSAYESLLTNNVQFPVADYKSFVHNRVILPFENGGPISDAWDDESDPGRIAFI